MEIALKKNEAAYLTAPMIDTTTPAQFVTGETVTDTAYYKDGAGAWTTLAITDTFTEIGTTGVYSIDLTAAELNHDLVMIKMTSTNGADTTILLRLYAVDIDDLVRSTTPANALDVSATGEAGIDWANVGGQATSVDLSATAINLCDTVTTNTDMRGTDSAALATVCTETRLAELDAANIPTDLSTITAYVDELETRLTALRAGYLDNLNGHTAQTGDSYARLGAPAGASVSADILVIDNLVDDLETRLTALRAGYLDNLNGHTAQTGDNFARLGAPVGASISADIQTVDTVVDAVKLKTDNLPDGIQKNTALNNFEFLLVDSTDHVTPKTLQTVTATRSIDGAAFAACANAVTEVASGVYKINLATTDLNGDVITFRFTAVAADDRLITVKTNS